MMYICMRCASIKEMMIYVNAYNEQLDRTRSTANFLVHDEFYTAKYVTNAYVERCVAF